MKTKNKEIINKNILIAEFMGGEPVNKVKDNPIAYSFPFEFGHQESWDEGGFLGSGKSSCWDIEDLQYHLSWDWLMPVINKIGKTDFDTAKGMRGWMNENWSESKINLYSPIDVLFNAVVNFIKWYSEHKK